MYSFIIRILLLLFLLFSECVVYYYWDERISYTYRLQCHSLDKVQGIQRLPQDWSRVIMGLDVLEEMSDDVGRTITLRLSICYIRINDKLIRKLYKYCFPFICFSFRSLSDLMYKLQFYITNYRLHWVFSWCTNVLIGIHAQRLHVAYNEFCRSCSKPENEGSVEDLLCNYILYQLVDLENIENRHLIKFDLKSN